MNSLDISLSVGAKECLFVLKKPCDMDGKTAISICLSFQLSGNFLPAALHDDIHQTVDYFALCEYIKTIFEPFACKEHENVKEALKHKIASFSPLISGALLTLTMSCHRVSSHTIHFDQGLLSTN
jgi:dihydroneopterin aldolase